MDRSISGPGVFIESNVNGTYNLLQAVRGHYEGLSGERRESFRMHHISTDEVFGSLGAEGRFSETTPYDPAAPTPPARRPVITSFMPGTHLGATCGAHQLLQQLRPLAVPGKTHPVVTLKAAGGESILSTATG